MRQLATHHPVKTGWIVQEGVWPPAGRDVV